MNKLWISYEARGTFSESQVLSDFAETPRVSSFATDQQPSCCEWTPYTRPLQFSAWRMASLSRWRHALKEYQNVSRRPRTALRHGVSMAGANTTLVKSKAGEKALKGKER